MTDDFYVKMGERVSALRRLRDMTQEELSAKCDLTTSYLAKIENGRRKPALDVIRKIAAAMDVSVSSLIGDTKMPELPSRLAVAIDGLSDEMVNALITLARTMRKSRSLRRSHRR